MGLNYNEILLVSDIDGTLNDKRMKLPPNNKKAIKKFTDNGGIFTLCSGRNLESLSIHYDKLNIQTPAIFLNGAGIYDFKSKEILQYNPISEVGEKIILDVIDKNKTVQLTVFDYNMIYRCTRKCLYGLITSKIDGLSHTLCKKVSDLPTSNWGKVTLFAFPKKVKKLKAYFENEDNKKIFDCFLTSPFTLEIVNNGVNKGSAVHNLADILNVNRENVFAIGDYYNDLPMLKVVSHPACCGQAPQDIKEICEYTTCHCNNGAVSDFLEYINKNYISND